VVLSADRGIVGVGQEKELVVVELVPVQRRIEILGMRMAAGRHLVPEGIKAALPIARERGETYDSEPMRLVRRQPDALVGIAPIAPEPPPPEAFPTVAERQAIEQRPLHPRLAVFRDQEAGISLLPDPTFGRIGRSGLDGRGSARPSLPYLRGEASAEDF